MDFAKLMSAHIKKGKDTASPSDSKDKKYLKRSEVEAQRQAAYVAEQEAEERARRERSDRKRKAEEEEAEKESERREKRMRLAEESRQRRKDEEEAEERRQRKRLGLPDLPPKQKEGEDEGTPIPDEEDIKDEDLVAKLRALDEPARVFGETHKQRLKRYKKRVGADSLAAIMTDGPIPTTLQLVPEKDMKVVLKVPQDKEGREFLFRQLASYFTMVLKEWDTTLAHRDPEVKESYQGKQAYAAMVQARENMRPLFKKLEKFDLLDSILEPVVEIVHAAQERRYVDANDGYLRLSIGKAAWPIGVTMEAYFTYPPEPQSAVDHDILFRPGIAPDGSDTFTPRTVIYDLKGAFGSMRKINALYEAEDDRSILDQTGVWPSKPIIQRATQTIPQSAYQEHLDAGLNPPSLSTSTVRYWSDYSRVYYHPKSIVQLSEFEVNDQLMPFENWEVGMELFEKLEREVDLVDRDLRPFVEECDGIQGLQIFTGVDDAWGGWASGWLERLRDEYGKMSIWTWGLGNHGANTKTPRERRLQQVQNSSRSLQILGEQSSVYIPMSNSPAKYPGYLSMDATSSWHIAALQAVGLESMTISSRLRTSLGGRGTLQDLENTINSTGKRRIGKFEMSVADPDVLSQNAPGEIASAEKAGSTTSRRTSDDDSQLSNFDIDVFTRDYRVTSRRPGKKEHTFGRAESSRGDWALSDDYGGRDPHDRFENGPAVQRFTAPILFPLLDSFPASIFDVGSGHATKLGVHAGLSTSTAVADQIRAVEQVVKRMVGIEEREALCNGLQVLAEEYDEGWDSGTDSDDDDE
ncbi:tubulin nucleotide-binding domain-like protein [Cucurbitaria berberidis CBS 394.84]|uniref:Tubulin nucleotide-binding domain-like protein n=1 Tax=Cucurbitaria berberidis CBS 394.84 TaxID=1168544 RepID=A0A9P4GF45_9PLEO|nr:tubulin nucleotide-binding domain-like protein [Cucurbitaria berberidis CBS 394.84]KAF1844121.1 tubulin nucleotide-binding domain-like protein [Cucurbitaria berberidis CBS 394.84]